MMTWQDALARHLEELRRQGYKPKRGPGSFGVFIKDNDDDDKAQPDAEPAQPPTRPDRSG